MLADTFFIIAFYLFKEVFCGFNNFLQCFDTYAHYVYQTGKIIFFCLQSCCSCQAGFDVMVLLGKETTLSRMRKAVQYIKALA